MNYLVINLLEEIFFGVIKNGPVWAFVKFSRYSWSLKLWSSQYTTVIFSWREIISDVVFLVSFGLVVTFFIFRTLKERKSCTKWSENTHEHIYQPVLMLTLPYRGNTAYTVGISQSAKFYWLQLKVRQW